MKTQIDYFESNTNIKVNSIQAIYGGLNSNNYLINESFVLRLKLPIIDRFYKPSLESHIENSIQPFNLSTELIFFDADNGHKVTRYIPHTTHFDKRLVHQQWPLIVNHLRHLHALNVEKQPTFNAFERILFYQQLANTPNLTDNQNTFLSSIQRIEHNYPIVLSHNDLVQGNMLFRDNQSWLIDFEYASYNSLLFDYFSFISENKITDQLDLDWTQHVYFQNQPKLTIENFQMYHAYIDLLWYYWAKAMFYQTNLPIYESIALDKKESFTRYYHPSK